MTDFIPDFAKIVDHPTLIRDMRTGAVLQTDQLAVRRHDNRVKELELKVNRDKEFEQIKCDVLEIKDLLRKLVTQHT